MTIETMWTAIYLASVVLLAMAWAIGPRRRTAGRR